MAVPTLSSKRVFLAASQDRIGVPYLAPLDYITYWPGALKDYLGMIERLEKHWYRVSKTNHQENYDNILDVFSIQSIGQRPDHFLNYARHDAEKRINPVHRFIILGWRDGAVSAIGQTQILTYNQSPKGQTMVIQSFVDPAHRARAVAATILPQALKEIDPVEKPGRSVHIAINDSDRAAIDCLKECVESRLARSVPQFGPDLTPHVDTAVSLYGVRCEDREAIQSFLLNTLRRKSASWAQSLQP